MKVNHLVYIKPSLKPDIDILTELITPFRKERGPWSSWSFEHLVRVLRHNAQSGGRSGKHIAQIDALKGVNWVQDAESLSLSPVLKELADLRRSFGILDFDVSEDMLRSLTTEIKRQLISEKVAEPHRKFNKNLAEHVKNMETKDRRAFSSLRFRVISDKSNYTLSIIN